MKNFNLNISVRIILITLTIFAAVYIFVAGNILASVCLTCLVVYQVMILIRYAEKANYELANFLKYINYSDFTCNLDYEKLGHSFKDLSVEFNKIFEKFKQARSEKEESLRYLETVIQHVGVGLISFDSKGDIGFINRAAKKLLTLKGIKNISSLDRTVPGFSQTLFSLPSGKKAAVKITETDEIIQLLLYATDFRMKGMAYKLVALQNIHPELEEKEIEAWQKLIRVLTHEIMNSVTPISSLASTVNNLLQQNEKNTGLTETETLEDIKTAVGTIQKRSEGLINFVEKYRSLTKIPKPDFKVFKASQLFERIKTLIDSALPARQISLATSVEPPHLELTADPDLIEQVLINLLNNAIQSITNAGMKTGLITLSAQIDDRGRALIKVSDNGPGISPDIQDKIFIPFFTTKKEGSGIGLSLSQQIMRSHSGTLGVTSTGAKGTVFTLRF
jgi:Signal transduction histidine kinase involved in nitrogen fixation and metabolism regulation